MGNIPSTDDIEKAHEAFDRSSEELAKIVALRYPVGSLVEIPWGRTGRLECTVYATPCEWSHPYQMSLKSRSGHIHTASYRNVKFIAYPEELSEPESGNG
jgi:hypothetical protein